MLQNQCIELLRKNIVQTNEGEFLPAGSHQFRTLWVRDFCLSVKGLLSVEEFHPLIKRQLELFLKLRRGDELIARGVDCIPPQLRVVLHTAFRFLPEKVKNVNYHWNLKPEYLGEHKTIAFDSNILFLIACSQVGWYDKSWFESILPQLKSLYHYYDNYFVNDLLTQPPYSDWQDSVNRSGSTFYIHILYLIFLKQVRELGEPFASMGFEEKLGEKVCRTFFCPDSGLFKTFPEQKTYSLESQLWAIEHRIFDKFISTQELYKNLKTSVLWNNLPGIPVSEHYANQEISWTTKAVGLRHYHDGLYWSWLIAEAAKISKIMGDKEESERILGQLKKAYDDYQTIHEVYLLDCNKSFRLMPYSSWLYHSEEPFTWGISKILEALSVT